MKIIFARNIADQEIFQYIQQVIHQSTSQGKLLADVICNLCCLYIPGLYISAVLWSDTYDVTVFDSEVKQLM